MTDMNKNHLK